MAAGDIVRKALRADRKMRALILTLAVLAGIKIWVHERAYRTATEEAIVHAYRTRAADACAGATRSATPPVAEGADWTRGSEPRLAIGDPALPIHIWQFDHELWNARFRQPYLVLSSPSPALSCTYDILAGTASITRS
jgi:hypothetical protein